MSFEFKEGDVVKIEGVLVGNNNLEYPLRIELKDVGRYISVTVDGKQISCDNHPIIQLVFRPKKKVTKWNWVCEDNSGSLHISLDKYESSEDFNKRIRGYKLIQKIDSTAEEFEVSDD